MIAEIELRGWTHDGNLRHASYKGLRENQDNAAVFDIAERPARALDPFEERPIEPGRSRAAGRANHLLTLLTPNSSADAPIWSDLVDTLEVRVRQYQFRGGNVLRHTLLIASTWDRHDVVLSREQPSQRKLGEADAFRRGERGELFCNLDVLGEIRRRPPPEVLPEIVGGVLIARCYVASQETTRQRGIGNQSDA